MTNRIITTLCARRGLCLALLTAVGLMTASAESEASETVGIYNTIFVAGDIVYSDCTTGMFVYNNTTYNGKPVYQNPTYCRGADWYLYFHNNRWAISFQDPLVSPSHGVTSGLASDWPWDDVWGGGAVVTGVYEVTIGGPIAYADCTNATFELTYETHNDKPVWKNPDQCRGAYWYLYFHNNRWSISFEDPAVSASHGVTSGLASEYPWDDVWPGGAIVTR